MTSQKSPITIGLLYPGIGAADDYEDLARQHAQALDLPIVSTPGDDVAHLVEELIAVGASANLLNGAHDLAHAEPDAVMWACTSGSFVYGWDGAHRQADEIRDVVGVPASSTSIAFAEACRALGLRTVAIAASYPEELARCFERFLEDSDVGVRIVSFCSNDIATAGEVGRLGRDEVVAMTVAADHRDAQAVLVPDTAMHSLAWVEDLERATGKIVLTANQVTVWEGMRLAGAPTRLPGLGALFR